MDKLSHGVRVVIPLCLNGVRVATVEASCCTMYEYEEGYLAARMLAYDYDKQCWIKDGVVQACGHPEANCGCYGKDHQGEIVTDAETITPLEA